MVQYEKLYHLMFNAASAAIEEIGMQNIGLAKGILMQAQIDCENIYIEGEEAIKLMPFGAAKEETDEN